MPITNRKPRPLARDKQTYRDDRLFIVACDDTYAPKQYFEIFRIPRIQVFVVETHDTRSSAEHVLERLLAFEHQPDDERWLVLDTDHCTAGPHLQGFTQALSRARQHGIRVALSKHCFELWLLLHHIAETDLQDFSDCTAIDDELKRVLGKYDKTNLDLSRFTLAATRQAYQRARLLDERVTGGDIPATLTTRVYKILHSICSSAQPNQLPEELRSLPQ
jgi:hypothetical protein